MFSLICAWINGWVNSREVDDLRRHHAHYDIIVMTGNAFRIIFVLWGKSTEQIVGQTLELSVTGDAMGSCYITCIDFRSHKAKNIFQKYHRRCWPEPLGPKASADAVLPNSRTRIGAKSAPQIWLWNYTPEVWQNYDHFWWESFPVVK